MKNKKKGFTIIELLVVVAIIGVLSGVVLGNLSTARAKTRNVNRVSDIDQINKALELYAVGAKAFPSTSGAWVCVKKACTHPTAGTAINPLTLLTQALTPNISMIPTDPTFITGIGDDYTYNSNVTPPFTGAVQGIYLSWVVERAGISTGSNKVCGHGNFNATVTNGHQCFLFLGDPI